jgi:hypothetical protein
VVVVWFVISSIIELSFLVAVSWVIFMPKMLLVFGFGGWIEYHLYFSPLMDLVPRVLAIVSN